MEKDTIELLKECDAGAKMAVSSVDEVFDKISDPKLMDLLKESKSHHEKLCDDVHHLLNEHHSNEKDPNPMAKGMSWLKTNMKLTMDDSDAAIADLMIGGCHMGIKSLHKYLNQYQAADETSKGVCSRLIAIEKELVEDLYPYL